MRLLYVCSDFGISPSGTKGASIHVQAITRALCDCGHQVLLLSPRGELQHDHPAGSLRLSSECLIVQETDTLRRWLKGHDLPHRVAQDLRPLLYNAWVVPRALRELKDDPPDAIIERLSLFSHIGADLADSLCCPMFLEVNALLTQEARQFRHLELVELAEEIESRVLQRADGIMVVSSELVPMLVAAGVSESKIHVVPNGADVTLFDPADDGQVIRQRLNLSDAFVVGFAGSLKVWHGVDLLVEAFEALHASDPSAKLLVVGTGPAENDLRSEVNRTGLGSAVVFTGAIKHEQIPVHLAAMDVAVAPFRRMEQFYFSPLKLFEYMAAGRCVVASRLGQIEEVVTDGENGVLCDPDDVASLADAMLELRRDPDRRQHLASAGRQCVEQNHTWQKVALTATGLIKEQIDGRSAPGKVVSDSQWSSNPKSVSECL